MLNGAGQSSWRCHSYIIAQSEVPSMQQWEHDDNHLEQATVLREFAMQGENLRDTGFIWSRQFMTEQRPW